MRIGESSGRPPVISAAEGAAGTADRVGPRRLRRRRGRRSCLAVLAVRAKPVEDEGEHARRPVVGSGCGPPERAGELEEVGGVGVGADRPVPLAGVEQRVDRGDHRPVGLLGDRPVRVRAQCGTEPVLAAHGLDEVGRPEPQRLDRGVVREQVGHSADDPLDLALVDRERQRLAGGEVAVERARADPRALGDLVHRGRAVLGERRTRGGQDARTVLAGVDADHRTSLVKWRVLRIR